MRKCNKPVAIALLLWLLASGAAFTRADEIADTAYEPYSSVLVSLGIMQNQDDSTFSPADVVTRGEFAAYIYAFLGRPAATDNRYYTDVAPDDSYYKEINTLTACGMISGTTSGVFSPDQPILFEQAVKILVSVCGYDVYAAMGGGYPMGYLTMANEKKILDGMQYASGHEMIRGEIARLIYNAMKVEVLGTVSFGDEGVKYNTQKGETVLSLYSSVYSLKGIVTATENTGLSLPSGSCRDGHVMIAGVEMGKGLTNASDLIGQHVEVYYYDDINAGEKTIKAIFATTVNQIMVLSSADITDFHSGVYQYELVGKSYEKRISDVADIIFNQKAYTQDADKNIYIPDNGTVTLIDNNNDNTIEVVVIESYKTYFVKKINSTNLTIVDKYVQPVIHLDGTDKKYKILQEGEEVKINAIKENTVVMVYADKEIMAGGHSVIDDNSTLYTVVLCSGTVDGAVSEVEDDQVTIDGKKYRLSKSLMSAFTFDPNLFPPVKSGDHSTYYLDNNNKIAGTLFKRLNLGDYGFLVKAGKESGVTDEVQLKIFTSDSQMKYFTVKDSVTLNGTARYKAQDIYDLLSTGKPALVHYVANDNGFITKLDISVTKPANGSLTDYQEKFSLDMVYPKGVQVYDDRDIIASQYKLTADTKYFIIPVDTNGNLVNSDSQFSNTSLQNGKNYTDLQLYDISASLDVGAVVVFDSSGTGGGGVANTQDIVIVDKVAQSVNDTGESVVRIKGWCYGASIELVTKDIDVKMVNENDGNNTYKNFLGLNAKDLLRGDVLQYTTNTIGAVSAIRILAHDIGNITYGYEGINSGVVNELSLVTADKLSTAPAPRLYYHESYFGFGQVTDIESNVAQVFVANKSWAEQDGGSVGSSGADDPLRYARTRSYFKADQTIVYVFNVKQNSITTGDFSNIEQGDFLAAHIRGGLMKTMLVVKQ